MEEAKNGKKTAPTDGEEKKQNLKQIIIFLLITFILTYGVEIFMIMPMRGSTDINEAYAAQSLIAGVMFVPALSALFTRMITKERLGPNNLMITINLKGNLKYYGLVWPGFALLILLGTVLYFLLFPAHFDPELGYLNAVMEAQAQMQESAPAITPENVKRTLIMQILMAAVISPFVNLINCFGEEWGWRGFLLPKMMKQMKIVPADFIRGVFDSNKNYRGLEAYGWPVLPPERLKDMEPLPVLISSQYAFAAIRKTMDEMGLVNEVIDLFEAEQKAGGKKS